MNKLLFSITAFFFLSFSSSNAQSYGPFEWDIIGFGIVMPSGDGISNGFAFYTEPRYNVNDQYSASLRLEGAIFGSDIDDDSVDIGISSSYTIFGDYYLANNKNMRAFAGLGVGAFGGASITITDPVTGQESEVEGGSSVGLVPRVGYELGLLRLGLEYNYTFGDDPNYLGLKFGLTIGGRYKG